jgi:SNW domain-containing protein 1
MLAKYQELSNKHYSTEHVVSDLSKPSQEELAKTTAMTKSALEKVSNTNRNFDDNGGEYKYIRYTPGQQGLTTNSVSSQRIIKMTELSKDPLEPVKFRHKRIPRDTVSPPVPIMHSPPRKLTLKDQQDWKIAPSISNWKNQRGYTIPLEMRLSADGRNFRDVIK